MRTVAISTAAFAAWCLTVTPAAAAQRGHGKPAGTPSPHATTVKTAPPKTHGNPHTSSSPHTTPHTTTHTTSVNPIAQKLQGKPLGDRVQRMLPAGMTLDTASAGFKNQGQFIAAVHVSRNLGIPFGDLKAAMLGTSTTAPMSLGQSIQRLRPTVDATTAVRHAEREADADLHEMSSSTTATSRKKTTVRK